MRSQRGLVRLGIVSVVVRLGVDRIIMAVSIGLVALVGFIVTVRILNILDRVLKPKVSAVCLRAQRSYSRWVGRRGDRLRA